MKIVLGLGSLIGFLLGSTIVIFNQQLELDRTARVQQSIQHLQDSLNSMQEGMLKSMRTPILQKLQKTTELSARVQTLEQIFRESPAHQLHVLNNEDQIQLSLLKTPQGIQTYSPQAGSKVVYEKGQELALRVIEKTSDGVSILQVLELHEDFFVQLKKWTGLEFIDLASQLSTLEKMDFPYFEKSKSSGNFKFLGEAYQITQTKLKMGKDDREFFVLNPENQMLSVQKGFAREAGAIFALTFVLSLGLIFALRALKMIDP